MEPATPTTRAQRDLETRIASIYRDLADLDATGRVHRVHRGDDALPLQRDRHARYAAAGLGRLPAGFSSLDASRPWIVYWVLHSLALLRAPLPDGIASSDVVAFLSACKAAGGGYGGGPGQMAHLAPTYAAVCALLTLGGDEALASVDRPAVAGFLRRMVVPPERGGGFTMHDGGEADARACYTAIAVATALHLDVEGLAADSGVVGYLQRCQTVEGGLGGEPGNEAHGGYTYCGAAALALLGHLSALDLPRLARWVAQRQGTVEGGFNGRTNKLVDGCYSWWQGGVMPLLAAERQLLIRQALAVGPPVEGDADLQVPVLPSLGGVVTPYDEACRGSDRVNDKAELLLEQALAAEADVKQRRQQQRQQQQQQQEQQAQDPASKGTDGAADSLAAGSLEEAEARSRLLLKQAEEAQRVAEEADLIMEIAQYSAAQLFVCFDGEGSPAQDETQQQEPAASGSSSSSSAAAAAGAQGQGQGRPAALFDTDALQVWVLKGCQQQLKGGLRDKPGKPPDYYHTCYCLSGLSAAQHAEGGGGMLGAAGNQLRKASPLLNVLEEKVEEAAAYFGSLPRI